MGKYSSVLYQFYFFYLLICLLIFNINVKIFLLFSQPCCLVLLLGVSLMAGSTTGVPMSPCYGANQTVTPPPSYTTYATTSSCTEVFKYYTTKAPEFYTTTYAAPRHYTDALKYYSAPIYYTAKATEYYMTTDAAPSYYTEASKYYFILRYLLHRRS